MDWFLMNCEMVVDYLTMLKVRDVFFDLKRALLSCLVLFINLVDWVRRYCNNAYSGLEPWQISAYTFSAICILLWLQSVLCDNDESIGTRIRSLLFRSARRLPWVKRKLSIQLNRTRQSVQMELQKNDPDLEFLRHLPDLGKEDHEIIDLTLRYKSASVFDYNRGRVSGAVYNANDELTELNSKMTKIFCWTNPLHPDIFPGIRKMEAEIVRMVCNLYHGGSTACGTVTSGGTESIILACLAYRNRAYKNGNQNPEMIIPITAHSAFDKAGHMLKIRVKHVPVDNGTFRVNVDKMKSMITRQTCMLVASAPSYPHGIIDPVVDIAALGEELGIPVHVDACLGGFLLPFMERADYPLEDEFDFRVPGVTSISCDTHKYGYACKGTSVLMYKRKQYLHFQYFSQINWPGGIYATATLAGSRSGSIIASCWATLLHFGSRGYIECTRSIIRTTRFIERSLRNVKGVYVMGHPKLSVVAFTSYVFNIYSFQSKMIEMGWSLNLLQQPAGVHFCVTMNQTKPGIAKAFIQDASTVAEQLLKNPTAPMSGTAAFYGASQSIPDRSIIEDVSYAYLDACYATEKTCPPDELDD